MIEQTNEQEARFSGEEGEVLCPGCESPLVGGEVGDGACMGCRDSGYVTVAPMPAGTRDPHYRPPVNRWRRVEVVCRFECMVGVILDSTRGGALVIQVVPGTEWDPRVDLEVGHEALPLTSDRSIFVVRSNERGAAVGHEFDDDGSGNCRICKAIDA